MRTADPQLQKRSQLLICSLNRWIQTAISNSKNAVSISSGLNNEPFSVIAMRINNPERSPFGINR